MAKPGPKPRENLLTGKPKAPSHLSKDEKKIFESVIADMETQKSFSTTDAKLIETYAITYVMVQRIKAALDNESLVVESAAYGRRPNPLLPQFFSGQKLLKDLLSKLQLTPGSRKPGYGSTDEEDASWEL